MIIHEVLVSSTVYRQIMQLISKPPYIEKVGLGFGVHDKNKITVKKFVSMINLDNSAVSFSLDYEVLYEKIQNHEKKGEFLIGIFHSHPKGTNLYPSQKDIQFMRYWPYPYLWLIGGGGGTNPKLAIFALLNEKIIKIPFLITET